MQRLCNECKTKHAYNGPLCEDCLLSLLAWFREDIDREPIHIIMRHKHNGTPIRGQQTDGGKIVLEVDIRISDQLKALCPPTSFNHIDF